MPNLEQDKFYTGQRERKNLLEAAKKQHPEGHQLVDLAQKDLDDWTNSLAEKQSPEQRGKMLANQLKRAQANKKKLDTEYDEIKKELEVVQQKMVESHRKRTEEDARVTKLKEDIQAHVTLHPKPIPQEFAK